MQNLLLRVLAVLIAIAVVFTSCSKTSEDLLSQSQHSRGNFQPTIINMGSDKVIPFATSYVIEEQSAMLNTCGTAPDTEAPSMGVEFYQVSGSPCTITGNSRPTLSGLTTGVYSIGGRAHVTGYRSCDDSTMADEARDTMQLRVMADVRVKITSVVRQRSKDYITYEISSNVNSNYTSRKLTRGTGNGSFLFIADLTSNAGTISVPKKKGHEYYQIDVVDDNGDLFWSPPTKVGTN